MTISIRSIHNPQVRQFYTLYWPQRQILHDFYNRLTEEQYDYLMVDRPDRQSDTPRQGLAHILYVQLVYMNGVKTGKLEFKSMGVEHYAQMAKAQLLAEWERIDQEMLGYLAAEGFSNPQVEVFWGGSLSAVDVLYFLRDHAILHVGWNLALMDCLNMPRYESLREYWG